jgi:hypothetical protein
VGRAAQDIEGEQKQQAVRQHGFQPSDQTLADEKHVHARDQRGQAGDGLRQRQGIAKELVQCARDVELQGRVGEEEVAVGPLALGDEQAHVEVHVFVAIDEVQRIELEQRKGKQDGAFVGCCCR